MLASNTLTELAKALSKAQGEMKAATRDKVNPFFKSKYADLAAVWDVCREPLSKNGLCVIQTTEPMENNIILETTLLHTSGEWIASKLALNPGKMDPQGVGSALTYARRYALSAMLGIASEEDDDAEAAMVRKPAAQLIAPKPIVAQDAAQLDRTVQAAKADRAAQTARAKQDMKDIYGINPIPPEMPTAAIVPPMGNQNPAASAPPVAVSGAPGVEQAKMAVAAKAFGDAIQWFWSEVKKENVDSRDVGKMLGTSLVEWLKSGKTAEQALKVVKQVISGKKPEDARSDVLLEI